MLNLDTNVLLAVLEDNLRPDERVELEADRAWGISAIVLWELTKLWQARRITIAPSDRRLRSMLDLLIVWPLTLDVAEAILRLDFSADPADELIAATSLVHGAPLLTRDSRMLTSSVVPLALR